MTKETVANQQKWLRAYDKIQGRVENAIKGECLVRYSAYLTGPEGIPINNLDDCPILGDIQFSEVPQIPVKSNPTWLEIAILANEMIKMTGDKHHFLEGIQVTTPGKEPKTVRFLMGS